MLPTRTLFDALSQRGVGFFTGVPDSLLKDICAYITDTAPTHRHVIAANEGNAVGLAAGHYLATGEVPLVYMQNSGLGNAVNPLTSLADPAVYGIPMVLLIGWRGEPGKKDEPQHVHMGGITRELLDAIQVPWDVLPDDEAALAGTLDRVFASARERHAPHALVVRKGTFQPYTLQTTRDVPYTLSRERAVEHVVEHLPPGALLVSTTGKTSRELFEIRERRGEPHDTDFLTVGSMGHSSQIALGVANANPDKPVVCLDGDGAALMHLGAMAIIASLEPKNYKHVIFNNAAHDSVGGQPTVGYAVDLPAIAKACGYRYAEVAGDEAQVPAALDALFAAEGPALLEIRVAPGARKDLGRPTQTPPQLKRSFMAAAGVKG